MIAGKYRLVRILAAVLFAAMPLKGDSVRQVVRQGNALYGQGEFAGAIALYDEALVDDPGAGEVLFNKANCYYRLDDLDEAANLYRQVAAESRDMALVEKAKYNLGNCSFQQGIKQKDSDLQKALEELEKSIGHWRAVLDINPDNANAARNIEVARLTIKDVIDQINKHKQQQQEQQEKQQQMQEKLKELIEKQKGLSEKTSQTNSSGEQGQITQEQASKEYGEQAKEQADIRRQTEQLAEQMSQQDPNSPQPAQMQQAADELGQAVGSQEAAEKMLKGSEGKGGKQQEDEAAEHLENALKSLSQGQQQDQQQGQDQQDQQDQQQQQSDPNESSAEDQQQQQQAQAVDATAQEILDKEQEQKKQRQMMRMPQRKAVLKDW